MQSENHPHDEGAPGRLERVFLLTAAFGGSIGIGLRAIAFESNELGELEVLIYCTLVVWSTSTFALVAGALVYSGSLARRSIPMLMLCGIGWSLPLLAASLVYRLFAGPITLGAG